MLNSIYSFLLCRVVCTKTSEYFFIWSAWEIDILKMLDYMLLEQITQIGSIHNEPCKIRC